MDDLQTEVVGILNNVLYYCDWVMLSDNSLASGDLSNYTTLRTSMRSTINNILTYTDTQLNTLFPNILNAASDVSNRMLAFTANMTALQTALNAL